MEITVNTPQRLRSLADLPTVTLELNGHELATLTALMYRHLTGYSGARQELERIFGTFTDLTGLDVSSIFTSGGPDAAGSVTDAAALAERKLNERR